MEIAQRGRLGPHHTSSVRSRDGREWSKRTRLLPGVLVPAASDLDELSAGTCLLHFSAVDHEATVWTNGQLAVHHEGGYTPFAIEVPDPGVDGFEIVVRASDDPFDLAKPRGKQDWQLKPHSI